jgi:Polyketide cyclase / dehydrase and lipid transport
VSLRRVFQGKRQSTKTGVGMTGRLACRVQRASDDVFDFVPDIRNQRAWNPRVIRLDKTSDGQIAFGTRFRGTYKGLGLLDTELVEYERPRRLGFRSTGQRTRIAGTFVLSPTDDALRLTYAPTSNRRACSGSSRRSWRRL